MPEPELFWLFVRPLNQAAIRYVLTGSVAAIFYGEPRLTNDVDFVVFLNDADIRKLVDIFPSSQFYLPPAEVIAVEARRESRGHFNIVHVDTGFKADFYLTGRDELNAWAFRARRQVQLEGQDVTLAPPEYVIVRKLEYYREGGSEKHLRDIRSILSTSSEQLDRAALDEWIRRRGLQTEWQLASGRKSEL
jgi:nucleotidyltransferase AbiEii toxin of type IV toxin-antitoxin system